MAEIIKKEIGEAIEEYMTKYGNMLIKERAIPDIRDGFKPVQRRILYSMYKNKQIGEKTHKSARVVGDVMGNYHPHGDQAIYETICAMTTPWQNIIPIIKGEGNFGNVEGDNPAAMRYTEITISPKIAKYLFEDLEFSEFTPNYDETLKEPLYLLPKIPFILFNGTTGIAYSIKTVIPQYTPNEIYNLVKFMINNRFWENENFKNKYKKRLLKLFKGPDSSTGADLIDFDKEEFLFSPKATATFRTKVEIKKKKKQIVIKSIVPETTSHNIYKEILQLYLNYEIIKSSKKNLKNLKIQDYLPLKEKPHNFSKGEKVEIILQYPRNADIQKEFFHFLKTVKTITKKVSYEQIYLLDKKPVTLSLFDYLTFFLKHREKIISQKIQKLIKGLETEKNKLNLLLFVVKNFKEIQEIITKHTKRRKKEKERLFRDFLKKWKNLSKEDITEILKLNLLTIADIDISKIKNDIEKINKEIKINYERLSSKEKKYQLILKEWDDFINDFKDLTKRKSRILTQNSNQIEVINKRFIVTVDKNYYLQKMPIDFKSKIKQENLIFFKELEETDYIVFIDEDNKIFNILVQNIDLNAKPIYSYVKSKAPKMFLEKDNLTDIELPMKRKSKTITKEELQKYFTYNLKKTGKKLI